MKLIGYLFLVLVGAQAWVAVADNPTVIRDDGIEITLDELEYVISNWPAEMQQAAANNPADRVELLNQLVSYKKMMREAMSIDASAGDTYWQREARLGDTLHRFMLDRFKSDMQYPDMDKLARERYLTQKHRYAYVPEQRLTSHILLLCQARRCDGEAKLAQLESILEQLKEGADFAELAQRYSEDPGSKSRGGKFDKWLNPAEKGVDQKYLRAAYEIPEVGDYSDIVQSKFGFHIIRLDDLKESYYLPYEKVKDRIVADLRGEYLQLQVRLFYEQYRFTDDASFDHDAIDVLLAPYSSAQGG